MKFKAVDLYVYLVILMVFIVPNGLIFGAFSSTHNHIFAILALLIHLLLLVSHAGRVKKRIFVIWIVVLIIAIYTKKFGFVDMITIPFLGDLIKHKERVKYVIRRTKILYVAIAFTLLYSVLYSTLGIGGRGEGEIGSGLVFTAIGEVNLTGLSIFCLALLVMKKNKLWGRLLFLFGLLTLSRSYMLALACLLLFNLKSIRRIVYRHISRLTYFNLTMISNVILIILGTLYIRLFTSDKILEFSTTAGFSRLFSFNDLSNLFRFLAIYLVAVIMSKNPVMFFYGMTDEEYIFYGKQISTSLNIPFLEIGPHNIFFSHLKIYGVAVLFEICYVSKYLKQITTSNNFGIFFAIFLYGVFLGTGLYNYWLFLTAITLIVYM